VLLWNIDIETSYVCTSSFTGLVFSHLLQHLLLPHCSTIMSPVSWSTFSTHLLAQLIFSRGSFIVFHLLLTSQQLTLHEILGLIQFDHELHWWYCLFRLSIVIWSRQICCMLMSMVQLNRCIFVTSALRSSCELTMGCWWLHAILPTLWLLRSVIVIHCEHVAMRDMWITHWCCRYIGSLYLSLKPKFKTLVWNQISVWNQT